MRREPKTLAARSKQLVTACAIVVFYAFSAGAAEIRAGMPLRDALLELQRDGLPIVFSSRVVGPEMKVVTTPRAGDPRHILDELLRPHQLMAQRGPTDVLIIVVAPRPVSPITTIREQIVVQPSRISLLAAEPAAPVSLTREEIESLPNLTSDVFRTLGRMPGAASNDLSAQFHLRGARRDELLILLDGQELYDAYHLRDFDNALGIVDSSDLARVNLISAAFPVSYGDRMTGVVDMVSASPPTDRRIRVSVSMIEAAVDAGGRFDEGTAGWIASLRFGTTDLLGRLFDLDEATFSDAFAKLDYQITSFHSLRLRGLISTDAVDTTNQDEFDPDEEPAQLDAEYSSSYAWLTHRSVLSEHLFVDTTASIAQTHRDRRGSPDLRLFSLRDVRQLDVAGVVQSWNFQMTPAQFLNGGFEFQNYNAHYDYARTSSDSSALRDRFQSEHVSFYLSDRVRATDRLTLEMGLRYDRHTEVDDNILSPRVNAAWLIAPSTVFRLGWGHFAQSHRAYELMVEDGDWTFYPAERSQHSVMALEHFFPATALIASLRLETYRRKVDQPRPRYENLLKPFHRFPEEKPDRVRLEPESATAEGAELMIRGRSGGRAEWWLNYAFAFSEDRIGGRDVPRTIDQKHALNLDVNYRLTPAWSVNAAVIYRSGRPITPFHVNGSTLMFGAINSEQLSPYHRADLRLSRTWELGEGTLKLVIDAQNVYNHHNPAGYDVFLDPDTRMLRVERETWPGFVATAGITWQFQ